MIKRTKNTVIRLLGILADVTALYVVLFSLKPLDNSWDIKTIVILVVISIIFIYFIVAEMIEVWLNYPKIFKEKSKINAYLRKWIDNGESVAIFTRDLSWAVDDIADLLRNKSRKNEVRICLPQKTAFTTELESLGAKVFEYPEIDYPPKSRFTIVKWGQTGSRVAIGRGTDEGHIIEEFSDGQHPAHSAAIDLIEIISRLDQVRKGKVVKNG